MFTHSALAAGSPKNPITPLKPPLRGAFPAAAGVGEVCILGGSD